MPARKPIRRGQLISPFGIGSMVDFPRDESLMPAGLDAWTKAKEECPRESGWLIREERLEERLGVKHFRLPMDHRDADGGAPFANEDVPFIRFPFWHYCHHCGGMEKLSAFSSTRSRCKGREFGQQSCANRPQTKRPFLIPVRFIAVCDSGHIQDFPFMEWVHLDAPPSNDCQLRLRAGRSSAGLSGIKIECSCGKSKTMGDVFKFDSISGGPLSKIKSFCKGLRPWLGETDSGHIPCGNHLRVLQRGASNVYFPYVVSSIYLPLWAETASADVITVLEQPHIWSLLSQATVKGRIDPERCKLVATIAGVDASALEVSAQAKLDGKKNTLIPGTVMDEEMFRRSEYQAILEGKVGPQTELYTETVKLEDYEHDFARLFSKVRLVHKLRETRALAGFTRILPPDVTLNSKRIQSLKLDSRIDWLPAIKVYGEGIFLELNQTEINQWLSRQTYVRDRTKPLIDRYNNARLSRQQAQRNITAKYLLMHSLAHILINQLSFDCGYGSASIRERLYCDFSDPSKPMNGLLLYTASGDSEGTMGGLVRQGKAGRLELTLRRALKNAAWCASDPVCLESQGQGSDSSNLAACHGCCLLPETCCEEGNRLLDRALLVGTPKNPELGFFQSLL